MLYYYFECITIFLDIVQFVHIQKTNTNGSGSC